MTHLDITGVQKTDERGRLFINVQVTHKILMWHVSLHLQSRDYDTGVMVSNLELCLALSVIWEIFPIRAI
jgi:hypothetical protein